MAQAVLVQYVRIVMAIHQTIWSQMLQVFGNSPTYLESNAVKPLATHQPIWSQMLQKFGNSPTNLESDAFKMMM